MLLINKFILSKLLLLLLLCGMNIDAFFIWLFFPWNSKDNIIIVEAMLIQQIHIHARAIAIDRVISVLFETLDFDRYCFITQMKCATILFCQPCMQSICLCNYSLISFLHHVRACMCSIVSQAMTKILHVQL